MTQAKPWLHILGWGEHGTEGLLPASLQALEQAELIVGAARHLAHLPSTLKTPQQVWPVPFAAGIDALLQQRGRPVVMLASQDPFWYGAGRVISHHLKSEEWVSIPTPSTFSWAASELGWPLEHTACLGLHAAPITRLRPHLANGQRIIALLRSGEQAPEVARWLLEAGFGQSELTLMSALGSPDHKIIQHLRADEPQVPLLPHPVAMAIATAGSGQALSQSSGLADAWFAHDGQFSKRPMRALTLSALAPCAGELLWDIGTGSGAIAIEWLLSHPSTQAIAFERNPIRLKQALANAHQLGVDRLNGVLGAAPEVLMGQPKPAAVFVGGGLSAALFDQLQACCPAGTRLVTNAVTLESESLLLQYQQRWGGDLLRIDVASNQPLGKFQGWQAAHPVLQWITHIPEVPL